MFYFRNIVLSSGNFFFSNNSLDIGRSSNNWVWVNVLDEPSIEVFNFREVRSGHIVEL